MTDDRVVLWREGKWRCELHAGVAGSARLAVYLSERLATVEMSPSGEAARQRATVLRHRVLRGDLTVAD